MVAAGLRVRGVPTSRATASLAAELGIPVVEELIGQIDLAVDGADEVDPNLALIKGRGGAHLREKLVASAAKRFVIVVDESKLVGRLGQGVLPVEVSAFLWRVTAERLARLCTGLKVRGGEEQPFITDNGNLILDLAFAEGIDDPATLGAEIKNTVGVMDHGLFVGMADTCIVAGPSGPRVLGGPL
jgi:ribose 5-phosphate isomerase A